MNAENILVIESKDRADKSGNYIDKLVKPYRKA
jgi:hypothetical protein